MNLYDVRKKLNMGISLTAMKLRVTDYARVSTDHLEQQKSLTNQIDYFDEMIKNNENWVYVDGYIDDGVSGMTDYKRSNFMKMIEDAKDDKFDLIITKEISRFSRNTLDSIKYIRKLLSYGVAVLFVNDNINTALPDAELRLTIMASMAQDEVRRLSERVKFGMNRSIKKGTILGNNMLYGYKKDKKTGKLVIVEKEAFIVKRLFNLYAINNWSISRIAKVFNSEGIKTCQNKSFCISTLTRMLKNPKYKGYYCGGKTEVIDFMTKKVKNIPENEWILYEDKLRIPPIVEEDLWERANDRLRVRMKRFGKDYKKDKIMYQSRYLLSAKLYCSIHSTVFHRRKQCKSCDDVTWICAKYLKEGKHVCDSPNIRESELYTILNDVIELLGINSSIVLDNLLNLYKISEKNLNMNSKLLELKKQRDKLKIKKDKLLELSIEENITNSEFNVRNNECNRKIAIIDEKISLLNVNCNDGLQSKKIESIIEQMVSDITMKKYLINLLLNKIIVSKIDNDKENISLKIYLNLSKSFFCKGEDFIFNVSRNYEFKRGFNTTGTRRYIVKYQVFLYLYD